MMNALVPCPWSPRIFILGYGKVGHPGSGEVLFCFVLGQISANILALGVGKKRGYSRCASEQGHDVSTDYAKFSDLQI